MAPTSSPSSGMAGPGDPLRPASGWRHALTLCHALREQRPGAADTLRQDLAVPQRHGAACLAAIWAADAAGPLVRDGSVEIVGDDPLSAACRRYLAGPAPRGPLATAPLPPEPADAEDVRERTARLATSMTTRPERMTVKAALALVAQARDLPPRLRIELLDPLVRLAGRHPSAQVRGRVRDTVRAWARHGYRDVDVRTPLLAALRALGDDDLADELLVRAADLGDPEAAADLAPRLGAAGASAVDRWRLCWHRGDRAGMAEVLAAADPPDRAAILRALHLSVPVGYGPMPRIALAAATLAAGLGDPDPDVRGRAVDAVHEFRAAVELGSPLTADLASWLREALVGADVTALTGDLASKTARRSHRRVSAVLGDVGGFASDVLAHAAVCGNERALAAVAAGVRGRTVTARRNAARALGGALAARQDWAQLREQARTLPSDLLGAFIGGALHAASPADPDLSHVPGTPAAALRETLEAAGVDPWDHGLRWPVAQRLSPAAVAGLIVLLGTDRLAALSRIELAVATGARLGPVALALAGMLISGDGWGDSTAHPSPVRTLALASRHEDLAAVAPFVACYVDDPRDDIHAAAAEIVARAGRPVDVARLVSIGERPLATGNDGYGVPFPAARHAAEALHALPAPHRDGAAR